MFKWDPLNSNGWINCSCFVLGFGLNLSLGKGTVQCQWWQHQPRLQGCGVDLFLLSCSSCQVTALQGFSSPSPWLCSTSRYQSWKGCCLFSNISAYQHCQDRQPIRRGNILLLSTCTIAAIRRDEDLLCWVPLIPCFLDRDSTKTIPHKYSSRQRDAFECDCADGAGPNLLKGSHVYKINTWLWNFGRPQSRVGGLSVAKTEKISWKSRSKPAKRLWATELAHKWPLHSIHHSSLLKWSTKQVICVGGMAGIEPMQSKSNEWTHFHLAK